MPHRLELLLGSFGKLRQIQAALEGKKINSDFYSRSRATWTTDMERTLTYFFIRQKNALQKNNTTEIMIRSLCTRTVSLVQNRAHTCLPSVG